MKKKLSIALLLGFVLLPTAIGATIRCINIMQARICAIIEDDGTVSGGGVVIKP